MSSQMLISAVRAGSRATGGSGSSGCVMKAGKSWISMKAGLSLSRAGRRGLATVSPATQSSSGSPKYRKVPFVREDLSTVMEEVPDFKYYYIGNENASSYPYKNIPMDQPILDSSQLTSQDLPKGEIEYSMLENGLRIASLDRGGMVSSVGLFVNAGCRQEDVSNFGVSHMIQTLAYHSTAHLSFLRTVKSIEVMGASAACNSGREHIEYSVECLRHQMPLMLPMMTGNVLFPRLLPWELKANHDKLLYAKQRIERMPDQMVSELLHTTAWHNNTLGHKVYATEKSLQHYNADTIRSFILDHFSPDNMVCVAVNVAHDELCKWVMRSFVDYNAVPSKERKLQKPVYTGGDARMDAPGGWNGNLVAYSLLQTLVGGGGAFSTGGPGKGMYTRLYLDVLNKYDWVESAMAFNTQYTDSGIFGLYMLASPAKAATAVKVLAEQFAKMKSVTPEELQRAKNSLKSSIYMNLECRGIVMEDIGRQLLMSGRVISPEEFCRSIDSLKEADIKRVAEEMFAKPPTVVAYGDISSVPHYEEVRAALKAAGVSK
ncbi:hypothetical protein Emag_003667 [Eimeria magna]